MAKAHEVSAAIKAGRIKLGWTQEELAQSVGVHPMTVSEWERGVSKPKDPQLKRLAAVLDTTQSALRYGDNGSRRNHDPSTSVEDRVPAIAAGLPKRVRVWMHGFLLELAQADVSDREIDEARRVLTSPENYTFYAGGEAKEYTEDEMMMGLEAFATFIRDVLTKRGYKLKKKK